MELGHRLCSIGSGPQGQYLVNQLTGEVLQLEQGWLWSLAWDASGQGPSTKEANGVCERVWLSSMLKVAIWRMMKIIMSLKLGLTSLCHTMSTCLASHRTSGPLLALWRGGKCSFWSGHWLGPTLAVPSTSP